MRNRSVLIDLERYRHERERTEQIEKTCERRIFDSYFVAGTKLRRQHAFDTVHCTGDDSERRQLESVCGEQLLPRRVKLRQHARRAIKIARKRKLANERLEVGKQQGIRIAVGKIDGAGSVRNRQPRRRRFAMRDARAAPSLPHDEPAMAKLAIRRRYRGRTDAERVRERAHRRQRAFGLQLPRAQRLFDAACDCIRAAARDT